MTELQVATVPAQPAGLAFVKAYKKVLEAGGTKDDLLNELGFTLDSMPVIKGSDKDTHDEQKKAVLEKCRIRIGVQRSAIIENAKKEGERGKLMVNLLSKPLKRAGGGRSGNNKVDDEMLSWLEESLQDSEQETTETKES